MPISCGWRTKLTRTFLTRSGRSRGFPSRPRKCTGRWCHTSRCISGVRVATVTHSSGVKGRWCAFGFVCGLSYARNASDRRSVSGGVVMCAGSCASFDSRLQRSFTLSSTEAEYIAMAEAIKEGISCGPCGGSYLTPLWPDSESAFNSE